MCLRDMCVFLSHMQTSIDRVSNESYHVDEYFVLKAWHPDEFSLELVEQVDFLVIDCMQYLIVPGKIWINEKKIFHSMDYLSIE